MAALTISNRMLLTLAEPQKLVVDHLAKHDNALVFVGLGIGKTASVLYALNELFLSADSIAALVIAPLRVISLTWPAEVRDWQQFSWMRVANLRTEEGQRAFLNATAHLYLINFESIPLLVSLVERRGKRGLPYDTMVVDELTHAKNPASKRINLLRKKVPRVKRNYGLTGTPIPNSYLDIFAQVRLIDGGERLGTSWTDFKKNYFFAPAHQFQPWKAKSGTAEAIEKKISDVTITLKSSEWLHIPDTVVEDVEVKFTPELQKQYHKLENELIIELRKDKTMNVASAATLVTKLLQFTSGSVYDEDGETHPIHNLKFEALKKVAREEKSPLLVAYMFEHEEARIREWFPQARFFKDCKHSSAEKTIAAERKLIEAWNRGEIEMLAAHPASISFGLNLQYGSNALLYISLTYNRLYYEQFIGRIARRGQENVTKIYRLMVPGTVDDAVAEALATKAGNEARLISALQMLESFRNT